LQGDETLPDQRRSFSSLRKGGELGMPENQKKAAAALSSLGSGMAGERLQNYLSSILLEVSPDISHEALLVDRGRKALAQELLDMLLKDETQNEKSSKPNSS